jgi:subtilase family protein
MLEPQALQAINAASQNPKAKTAQSLGLTGAGVTVAFIADGLDINNTDFIRPDGSHVFVDYKDFSGEGTSVPTGGGEAFLDASSIAAQGRFPHNISNYSYLSLNGPCYIRVLGVAPGASLVGLDIFGAEDAGFNSSFIQAIDYAVSVDHVNVLNESLGNNYYPDDQASLDIIKAANDAAVAAGTTVTVSSGDAGVTNTIGTPSTDPNVISAGGSTTYRAPSQNGYGGFQFPGVTGFLNNNISSFSSAGFEQDGQTMSLVAPGELNWALCSTDTSMYFECVSLAGQPTPVQQTGGTSESAPLTAGVAALVIQAYAKTHGGAVPSPALVKQFITSTAVDVKAPANLQGSGLLNAYGAVVAAESYKATPPAHTPNTLLESASQFNSVAAAGTPRAFTEKLTNLGSTPETPAPSRWTTRASPTTTRSSTSTCHLMSTG